jgi:hypothetical protein
MYFMYCGQYGYVLNKQRIQKGGLFPLEYLNVGSDVQNINLDHNIEIKRAVGHLHIQTLENSRKKC